MLTYCKLLLLKLTRWTEGKREKTAVSVSISEKVLMTNQAGTFAADKTTMSQLSKEKERKKSIWGGGIKFT